MSTLELMRAISNVEHLLVRALEQLSSGRLDAAAMLQIPSRFRQLGCGRLLSDLDVDGFADALYKAAKSYLETLDSRDRFSEEDAYYLCGGRAAPMLDALAVGAFDLAAAITERMPPEPEPDMEYEDDFRFFQLLGLLATKSEREACRPVLERFEAALEGIASARFDVVQALSERDSQAFGEALLARIDEWAEAIARGRESEKLDPYFAKTEAYICVEAAGLVQLARRLDLETRDEYPFVPDIVLAAAGLELPVGFSLWD